MKQHRTFTAEFKRSAVALVLEQNYTRKQAAESLGIGLSTLDYWLQQQRESSGAALSDEQVALKRRNAELQRELERVKMERDILKKAAAYFAKDQL